MGRIERLKEAHLSLEQAKYRTVKGLSIWDHGDYSGEPIVVRKARGLALLSFPKRDGRFDFFGYSSSDEGILSWCRDLFLHCWEKGASKTSE